VLNLFCDREYVTDSLNVCVQCKYRTLHCLGMFTSMRHEAWLKPTNCLLRPRRLEHDSANTFARDFPAIKFPADYLVAHASSLLSLLLIARRRCRSEPIRPMHASKKIPTITGTYGWGRGWSSQVVRTQRVQFSGRTAAARSWFRS